MPSPRPISRQFERSAEVPCTKRGYQDKGTVTVRPSTRSTAKESSVMETFCATAARSSFSEVLIPCSPNCVRVLIHQRLQAPYLCSAESATFGQSDRIKPELPDIGIPLRVLVPRFTAISRVEKEPIRSDSENRRHRVILCQLPEPFFGSADGFELTGAGLTRATSTNPGAAAVRFSEGLARRSLDSPDLLDGNDTPRFLASQLPWRRAAKGRGVVRGTAAGTARWRCGAAFARCPPRPSTSPPVAQRMARQRRARSRRR